MPLVKVADNWNTLSDTQKEALFNGAGSTIPSPIELENLGDFKVAIYSKSNEPLNNLTLAGTPKCQIVYPRVPIDLDVVKEINSMSIANTIGASLVTQRTLMHFEESATKDEYGNDWVIEGSGVGISSTDKKFGTSSLELNKLGALRYKDRIYLELDDFTIDFWYKVKEGNPLMGLLGDTSFGLTSNTGGSFYVNGVLVKNPIPALKFDDDWHHIAVTRKDGEFYLFIDGVLAHKEVNYKTYQPQLAYIGGGGGGGEYRCKGYFDELRVIKGLCMWTSNFTPPTEPYTSSKSIPNTGIRYACRVDNGSPMIFNGTAWKEIQENEIPYMGMSAAFIATLTKADWDKLIKDKESLDLIIAMNRRSRQEVVYLSNIAINYNSASTWRKAAYPSEYTAEYKGNKNLQLVIYPASPYKINYMDI